MSTPSDLPTVTATAVRQPRVSLPGLVVEELWLAPDAAVVAALTGADSTGTSTLLFLDTTTGAPHGSVAVGPEELAVLATGWTVGASHNWRTGAITVWRPVTGDVIGRLNPHRDRGVHALAIADRGEIAASIGEDGGIALWRPADGVVVSSFAPTSPIDLEECELTFSADGRLLAIRTDADTIELWTTAPLAFLDNMPETGDPVLSPDGRWAAVAGAAISLYDLRAGAAPVALPGHGPLAFTPDGSLLVAGAPDGTTTTVWRTDIRHPFGHLPGGSPAALSRDGQALVLIGPGPSLQVVDLQTGQTTAALTGHRGEIVALDVGPGGAVVVAACSDATLRVWA